MRHVKFTSHGASKLFTFLDCYMRDISFAIFFLYQRKPLSFKQKLSIAIFFCDILYINTVNIHEKRIEDRIQKSPNSLWRSRDINHNLPKFLSKYFQFERNLIIVAVFLMIMSQPQPSASKADKYCHYDYIPFNLKLFWNKFLWSAWILYADENIILRKQYVWANHCNPR